MPTKRTPTKKPAAPKIVSPTGIVTRSRSPAILSIPMSAAAEAAKAAAAATAHPGLSPDFLMYMQMQEQKDARNEAIRREDLARMEALRKEDLERASQERYAQQKLHEQQMQLLTKQLKNATKFQAVLSLPQRCPCLILTKTQKISTSGKIDGSSTFKVMGSTTFQMLRKETLGFSWNLLPASLILLWHGWLAKLSMRVSSLTTSSSSKQLRIKSRGKAILRTGTVDRIRRTK